MEGNIRKWISLILSIFNGLFNISSPSEIAARSKVPFLTQPNLRIFQRNGLKLDKDLIFSGLVQNVYVYQMAKSKEV